MSIDRQEAAKVAHLARLRVDEAELDGVAQDFNRILGFVDQLAKVDVTDIEPMRAVHDKPLPRRTDEVTEGDQAERVLANAPLSREGFFAVPKVVE